MGDFLDAVDGPDVVERVDRRRKTSVQAEDLASTPNPGFTRQNTLTLEQEGEREEERGGGGERTWFSINAVKGK